MYVCMYVCMYMDYKGILFLPIWVSKIETRRSWIISRSTQSQPSNLRLPVNSDGMVYAVYALGFRVMYIYIYVYIYICICIYIYIHMHRHASEHICMRIYIHIYIYMYVKIITIWGP